MKNVEDDLEDLPFLPIDATTEPVRPGSPFSRIWALYSRAASIHILYLSIYSLGLFVSLRFFSTGSPSNKNCMNTIVFDQESLSSRNVTFITAEESVYAGRPSDILDASWDELLHGINIRVSRDELERMNQTSVQLPDNRSGLAWLEATHQLHCVKFLRQWIYRDHYHPEVSADEEVHWLLHTDHCLELLRQAVMCHADTSLMTFEWDTENVKPMLKLEGPQHLCSDWDELMAKMSTRTVTEKEMDDLKNPLYGNGP